MGVSFIEQDTFQGYDLMFDDLVYDIVNYFIPNLQGGNHLNKSVLSYCEQSRFNPIKGNRGENCIIQPGPIFRICENLVHANLMSVIRQNGEFSCYHFVPSKDFYTHKEAFSFMLNCRAFGLTYVYKQYRDRVLPIVVYKGEKQYVGTCFKYDNGILTAKHCIEGDAVSIPGFEFDRLLSSSVLISKNKELDVAFIYTGETKLSFKAEPKVLDDVIVMGYPNIPMFMDFCSVDKATISAVVSRGEVSALADQYITHNVGNLLLVTARIRGGNSGGPLINSNGEIVGMAFCEPSGEGNYDDMGYGVAYPISVVESVFSDYEEIKLNFIQ